MGKQVIFGSNISFLMLSLNLFIRIFWNCTWSKGMKKWNGYKLKTHIFLTKWFDVFFFMVLVLEPCVNCYFEHSYVFIRTFLLWYTCLTQFRPMSHFNISWKCRKTYGFLTFSGGIDMWHWTKMRWETNLALLLNTITFFLFAAFLKTNIRVNIRCIT